MDEGEEESERLLISSATEALQELPGIQIDDPLELEEGSVLFEYPVAERPTSLPNPTKLLGLGTWDAFENIKADLILAFERIPPLERPGLLARGQGQAIAQ